MGNQTNNAQINNPSRQQLSQSLEKSIIPPELARNG